MESEMNNETWNNDYQPENQTNPCEQPTESQSPTTSFFQRPQLQKTWLNITLANWIKCLIVVALLSMAAFIAPKFTSAGDQEQDPTGYFQTEDDWYDYDYGYED